MALLQYRYLFADSMQCSRDLYGQYFSDTWFLLQRWREWSVPLWLPHERLGQPFMALLYTEALYPPRVLTALLGGEIRGPNWMHAFHALFAFAGSFLAARRMNLGRAAAFVAAVPFALGPSFVVWAENLSFAASAAWAGWNVWAALGVRATPTARRVAVLALTMTGAVFAGAPEMVLWQAVLVISVCGIRGLLATAWSALTGAVLLLPAAELSREFTRAGSAPAGQLEWSASLAQLVAIALPEADRPRVGAIWGTSDQWFWASLFIGASVVALSFAGVLLRKRARRLFAIAVFFALLSMGRNFGLAELFLRLPVLDGFRYPAKYLAATLFVVSMLAGIGVNRLQALARSRRIVNGFFAATVGVAIGLVASARLLTGLREGFAAASAWSLCISVLLAAILVWRSSRHLALTTAGLVALEMLLAPRQPLLLCDADGLTTGSPIAQRLRVEGVQRISARVDRDDEEVEWCEPTPAETIVRTSKQRLSNLRFVEEDLRAVSGYGFRDPWRLTAAFARGSTPFQLAGVSHLVLNTWSSPRFEGATPDVVASERDVWLWKMPAPFPRSWFVGQARVVSDEEALEALAGPAERFRREVLVGQEAGSRGFDRVAHSERYREAVTTEPYPELIVSHLDAPTDGYVVLADAWYPGWAVFIDGVEAQPFRANFFLRGVAVSRGSHEIEWRYQPTSVRLGGLLSLLGLTVIAVVLTLKRFGHVPA